MRAENKYDRPIVAVMFLKAACDIMLWKTSLKEGGGTGWGSVSTVGKPRLSSSSLLQGGLFAGEGLGVQTLAGAVETLEVWVRQCIIS